MDTPKYYKWSWGIDQRAIIESNLNIDIIDFSILRMLMDFSSSEACQKMQETGTLYYMFRWKLIKTQLPILNLNNRQSVWRRINKLIDAKILSPHPNNQTNRASWFRFAENRDLLFKTKCKQKLPSVNNKLHDVTNYSQKSQQPFTHSDNNRLHDNTINNNTINNNTGNKKILLPPVTLIDKFKVVIAYLTEKSGNKFRFGDEAKTKKSDKYIKVTARLREGHSIDDLKKVIDVKCSDWGDSQKFKKFLVPSTLFCKKNFEKYLDQADNQKTHKPKTKNLVQRYVDYLASHIENKTLRKEHKKYEIMYLIAGKDETVRQIDSFKRKMDITNPTYTDTFIFDITYGTLAKRAGTKPDRRMGEFKQFYNTLSDYNKNKGQFRKLFKTYLIKKFG